MKLWLARHAQPIVKPGICYGRLDVAADGVATVSCAQALASQLPADVQVVSSPLRRCWQLASALQTVRPDLVPGTDWRLQEMDFGNWEGQPWDTIGQLAIAAWTDDFSHRPAGGNGVGEPGKAGGESVSEFMHRVAAAFDALPTHNSAQVLWITHAGVARAVDLLARGVRTVDRADQWPLDTPKYGQWRILDLHRSPAD